MTRDAMDVCLRVVKESTFPTTKRGNIHQLRRMTIPS